jgi:hypothetical protein
MNLYLDDDTGDRKLVALLRKAKHNVVLPVEVKMAGESDPRHLVFALHQELVLVSRNRRDFQDLHDLIIASGGSHPGILIVGFDNDRTRDIKFKGIGKAIGNLERSGLAMGNQIIILNQWR